MKMTCGHFSVLCLQELIRFGQTPLFFIPRRRIRRFFLLEKKVCTSRTESLGRIPAKKVCSKFPNIRIKVFFPSANQDEWDSVAYGDTAPSDQFAKLEEILVKDHFLPLKLTPTTTNVSVVLETEPLSSSGSETNLTNLFTNQKLMRAPRDWRQNKRMAFRGIFHQSEPILLQLRSIHKSNVRSTLIKSRV